MFKHNNQKFVFAITGGGSLFMSSILCEGGASNYLVHFEIPYSTESLEAFTGGVREKYCSEATARQMAVSAELKGKNLGYDVIGIGASCSLAKTGEREGREHKIFVAAKYNEYCFSLEWVNTKQNFNREQEEVIAQSLIKIVSEIFSQYISNKKHLVKCDLLVMMGGIYGLDYTGQIKMNFPEEHIITILKTAAFGTPAFYDSSVFVGFNAPKKKLCVYPGSFNPIHADHVRNFKICQEIYGEDNCFVEISISNFEKPNLDSIELAKRIDNIRKITKNIVITNSALFKDKAADLLTHEWQEHAQCVFAVGADTFKRIADICHGWDFLVFPRDGVSAKDVSNIYKNVIDPRSFGLTEGENLSSSAIRAK